VNAVASQGFEADIKAADADQMVVLHRWADGMILTMMFDDEMPEFTTREIRPGELPPTGGKDALTMATGYVFRVAEPRHDGHVQYDGRKYAFIEIYDYVPWTDDEVAVRAKYDEVKTRAMAE